MRINASEIKPIYQFLERGDELLGNYDLHNEFHCVKIVLKGKALHLVNKHIKEGYCVVMSFYNADLNVIDFVVKEPDRYIEMIYRTTSGPTGNELNNGKAIFFIHIVYGLVISLWTDSIGMERHDDIPDDLNEVTYLDY